MLGDKLDCRMTLLCRQVKPPCSRYGSLSTANGGFQDKALYKSTATLLYFSNNEDFDSRH